MDKGCVVKGCNGNHKGRGLCHKHLQRQKRLGTTELAPPRSVEDRFWSRLQVTPACWLWLGGTTQYGYGVVNQYGRGASHLLAHRVSWELYNGPIPAGLIVCHRCDVPACVNPAHLFLGTQRDNMRDMRAKGRGRNGPRPLGSANKSAKLTDDQAREIKRRLAEGETATSIAADFPVGRTTIGWIKSGKIWRHVH